MDSTIALELKNIMRTFTQGYKTIDVLKGIDVSINTGELVALVGASGSGKSTLLQISGLLDQPSAGSVFIDSEDTLGLNDDKRTQVRREKLGFIYQFHHLMPEFTALENVALAARIANFTDKEAVQSATDILTRLGLHERFDHVPARLSGGEQQRVAIARALVTKPKLILADEPTGNLDEETATKVFELLLEIVRDFGVSAFIATHDKSLAAKMDRQLFLREGTLRSE